MGRFSRFVLASAFAVSSALAVGTASPAVVLADDNGVNPQGWYGLLTTTQTGETDTSSFSQTATWHFAGPDGPVTVYVVYYQTGIVEDFWCVSTTQTTGSAAGLPANALQPLVVSDAASGLPLEAGFAADYRFSDAPGVGSFPVLNEVVITERFPDENNCGDSFVTSTTQPGWTADLVGAGPFEALAGWTELNGSYTTTPSAGATYSVSWELGVAPHRLSESSEPPTDTWGNVMWPNAAHFNGYAQSFTASESGTMTKVELIVSAWERSTELIPVEIRYGGGTDGSLMATGWLSQAAIPIYDTAWEYAWVPVALSDPFLVSEGEQYTIVVGPLNPALNTPTPSLIWWGSENEYSRGSSFTHDADWPTDQPGWAPHSRPGLDLGFRTYLAPDPDADGDGVYDTIDVGDGAFDDRAGTSGSILSSAGGAVTVRPWVFGGVSIQVAASATENAILSACGSTFELEPGTDVTVQCPDIASPQVIINAPLDGGVYEEDQPVAADYVCLDEDGSGVVDCTGDVPSGALLDLSTPGAHTFTVTSRDAAGNEASSSVSYEVVATPPPPPADLVTAEGTQLARNGEPYTFFGMNVYNANTRVDSCWYPFTQAQLEASFSAIGPDVDVIRAWFFQDFATVDGQRSWDAFDQTLAAAEATGKKVIVTLGNQWEHCDTEGFKAAAWYGSGYAERNPALPASYRDYVAEVVERYAGRSSVMMWQLLNEAEVPLFTAEGLCDEVAAHALLKAWAADVSALIKGIDPYHLVSIGTIGSGQCGAQYTDYKSLHDLPTVDLCEFHDYGVAVMPGDQWNGLAFRLEQCAELNKPLFVGETGIVPTWLDGSLQARADLFRDKFGAQFSAGVVGEVVWAWNAFESRTDTYDIGPGDPVFEVFAGVDDPDGDDDGVDDSIDTGDGTFDDGAGTTGAIVNAAGHDVLVTADADGVRITVAGSGTTKAEFSVCGFTVRLAPGSEVVVACGSITTQVISGSVEIVLGDGLVTVSTPAGVTATLTDHADKSFSVTDVVGGTVAVTVDGVTTQVGAGESLTLEAWDFVGFVAPVDNGGVLNVVKAGQGVPLKWRVLDAAGSPVTDLTTASIRVSSLACSAGTANDQLEEAASGSAGLQNLGDGYYQLNWRTPKTYANSCKTMRLDIGDGVEHTALFQFKK